MKRFLLLPESRSLLQMRPNPANCDHLRARLDPAGLPGQMMRYVVHIVVGYNLAEFLSFAIPVSQSRSQNFLNG
ncbi:hypothetical protein TH5_04220 [Thalassospira xianhensis MCCC 1A02616]|uniref:Uncharacterized protein n=1 Tax=Thalassospira xianhensis MCCC 1A02616 TaxID=1177929 RepID=A0A367UHP3_9PROT|nr:hypothetical protein TH5_04220 [Thalassospira xianhensis MCCC 1A02616]